MKLACQQFREDLPDLLQEDGAALVSSDHTSECGACEAWLQSARRLAKTVSGLERLGAPFELDGLVVAALEAGVREERAIEIVRSLERRMLPTGFEELVEDRAELAAGLPQAGLQGDRVVAPSVLERLVAEELADPLKARVKRHVSALPREAAPAELAERLHAELQGAPAKPRRAFGRRLGLVGTSLAAAVLAAFFLGPLAGGPEPEQRERPFLIQAASLEDLGDLDPVAMSFIDGLGGGILSTRNL